MFKYQQLVIYGYKIPYADYNNKIKGTQFYKQYIPRDAKPSEGDIVLLPDMDSNKYCLFGIVQFATEQSDLIEPINPPHELSQPSEGDLSKLEEAAEQAPLTLKNHSHYIVTHSD